MPPSHVTWRTLSWEWRCQEMGPGSQGRSEMLGKRGLLPVQEGVALSLLGTPADSLPRPHSVLGPHWGFTKSQKGQLQA